MRMQTIYRPAWLCVMLLAAPVYAVEITRERADAMLAEQKVDPWERSKDASTLAWNESTVVDALLDLHDATGDTKYLDELVKRSDRILSHRDDRRAFKDHTGQSHKRWSIATKYTVAEGQLVEAGGKPTIQLRSLPIANNHMTKVVVTAADDGSSFSLVVTNKAWKREERFENLSVDPASPRYFATILNTDTPLPKPPAGQASTHSLLLRATPIDAGKTVAIPKAQELTLTPLWYAHVGYVGIIYHPMLKFAQRVKDDPGLARYAPDARRFVDAAEESFAEIRVYFRQGPGRDEGHYIGSNPGGAAPYDGVPQAFNYLAKQACSETLLFQLTGKETYRDHAVRIAMLFKNRLVHKPEQDLYVWKYWYEPLTTGWKRGEGPSKHYPVHAPYDVAEDSSHGTLDIAMVQTMADAGLGFDATDVKRMANTFLLNVAKADRSGFNSYVDGTDGPDEFENAAVYGWLPLSAADPKVYDVCREIYLNRGKDDFKSLARLLKWERQLTSPPGARG